MIEGRFLSEMVRCDNCHRQRSIPKEKQTDTNIATELVIDAFLDRWDVALLVSGDSDLVPPIEGIKKHFPKKRIIIVSPPGRISRDLDASAHGYLYINDIKLRQNQLPDEIVTPSTTLRRPEKWQ